MKRQLYYLFAMALISANAMADDSMYCPQNQGFIQVGMTPAQVLSACGQPTAKNNPNRPVMKQVPVKQLIYASLNKGSVYPSLNPIFDQWSISEGSQGVSLEVDIIHNKVSAVRINGSNTNAASLCNNGNFQIGTNENQVYNACGSPDHVNHTYINQPVPSNEAPEVWIYRTTPYQPPFKLTFTNGKLQSIEQ